MCQAIGQPELATNPRFRTLKDRKANEDEDPDPIMLHRLGYPKEEIARLKEEQILY